MLSLRRKATAGYGSSMFVLWALALLLGIGAPSTARAADPPARWSAEKANRWHRGRPWLLGANFAPSTAINQLEMWQADTFDLPTIDRELGWAEQIGFTSVRVFLHDLLWKQDPEGFLQRIDRFLEAADRRHIGVMFVLLDACWDPYPKLGKQRDPKPHVHNSGWVQSPGLEVLKDPRRYVELEPYIKGVVGRFGKDRRVQAWDIFNEPDNTNQSAYGKVELPNKAEFSRALIEKAYAWARHVEPTQPLTAGVWIGTWSDPAKLSPIERFMLEQSDVISFHCYNRLDDVKRCVASLRRYGRPVICTEYMSRGSGSTFDPILGYFQREKIGAYNWGLVAGKTQTIYPWDSWQKQYTAEPSLWFHDVFRADGRPYDPREVQYVKKLTGKD
jgi:hypothetical protein